MPTDGQIGRLRITWGPGGPSEKAPQIPMAIDLLCLNASGGTLAGGSGTGGCDWIVGTGSGYDARGIFRVKKAAVNSAPALGVVHWTEPTSIANGATFWARIYGPHDYAKVDGTTDVAIDDMLGCVANAGAVDKTTDPRYAAGLALAARTDNSIGAALVHVGLPGRVPAGCGC